MKIEEIINKLCSHEISKQQAIDYIKEISNNQRKNGAIEFNVESVSFNASGDGFLRLEAPYGYKKFENKIKSGDKVDVSIVY